LDLEFLIPFSVDDFKRKYAGSLLGAAWAFLQPAVTILLYWFVFEVGMKTGAQQDVPFILWLASGLLPWFFVSECVMSGTTCLADYGYLVKKVLFTVDILPSVKIVSCCFSFLGAGRGGLVFCCHTIFFT